MTLELTAETAVDMFVGQFDLKTAAHIGPEGISRAFNSWCEGVGTHSLSPMEKNRASALAIQRVMGRLVAKGLNISKPHASTRCPTCGRG